MDLRTLGRTGVHVSPLCLGAMMFGAWGEPDHDVAIGIIHKALDAGINFIDTADVYSRGESEEIVGKALSGGRRENVVLATKFHGTMGEDPNQAGNSRRWIMREVEASLKRLQTDWIDLYQVHRWDPWTDHDETLGALSDLVTQGKVRYIGSSTYPAVTAAIIGPRTMEQLESQLGAVEVQLDTALLDRIDEIVAPGTTINPTDAGWTNPALAAARRR
jgi:aryl-alcohol dehydrogenase-like predicted oxidoreductase